MKFRHLWLMVIISLLSIILISEVHAAVGVGYFVDSGQVLGDFASSSVALEDIDNDGDLDAFVTNAGANNIWKNNGAGIFEVGQSMGDANSLHAAFGDFDKDDDMDIFVVNSINSDKIWINDGKGNFTASQSLGTGHLAFAGVALEDLNGDGHLDAFVVGMLGNTVWLNDGTGTFNEGQNMPETGGAYVALGDLNGDNYPDAFIVIDGPNEVWLNDGKGIFTNSGQSMENSESTCVALGDLDGDNDLDAFVANANDIDRVWKNNGNGIFIKTKPFETLDENNPDFDLYSESYAVSLNDLDGDGDVDAFVANNGQPNKIWRNDGFGEFYKGQTNLEGTGNSWGISLGDLDNDGDSDAFVANNGQANNVWLNHIYPGDIDGNGSIGLSDAIMGLRILIAGAAPKEIFLSDINGDKRISMEEVVFILQTVSQIR